jgi:hypothetical protein
VTVEDVRGDEADQRSSIDDTYRGKYGYYGQTNVDRMVTDDAAGTMLRLEPEPPPG